MSNERVPCPFCAEPIQGEARRCPHCGEHLVEGDGAREVLTEAELRFWRDRIEALNARADEPADPTGQPGRFHVVTMASLLLFTAGVAIAFSHPGSDLLLAACLSLPILGIASVATLGNDLSVPSPRGRSTPFAAGRCFVASIRHNVWRKGYACLSPGARENDAAERPDMGALEVGASTYDLTSIRGFKAYWRSFTRPSGIWSRLIRSAKVRQVTRAGGVARLRVEMKVEIFSSLVYLGLLGGILPAAIAYLIVRRTHPVDFDVLVVRHRSQWWILTGEIGSRVDRLFPIEEPGPG